MIVSWVITHLSHMITTFQEYLSLSTVSITLMGGSIVSACLNFNLGSSLWETSLHFLVAMQRV